MPEFLSGDVKHIDLQAGSVELIGTTRSGESYTLSGDVDCVRIIPDVENAEYHVDAYGHKTIVDAAYWLRFKIKDSGEAYRIQLNMVDVDRTARVLADDQTAAAIEAARVRCGAPEDARFDFGFNPRGFVDSLESSVKESRQPTPVLVYFYWTERVAK